MSKMTAEQIVADAITAYWADEERSGPNRGPNAHDRECGIDAAKAIRAHGLLSEGAPSEEPPAYLALDVWQALGLPTGEFDAYYERNGWADTWSNLLYAQRGVSRRLVCGAMTDGDDPCVLREHDAGPHMGASDVGASEALPHVAAAGVAPQEATGEQVADDDLPDEHLPNQAYKVGRKIAERGDFNGLDAATVFMRGAVYGVRKFAVVAPEKVADVIHHAFPADSPYRCTHIINAPCVALATALCEAAKRGELT